MYGALQRLAQAQEDTAWRATAEASDALFTYTAAAARAASGAAKRSLRWEQLRALAAPAPAPAHAHAPACDTRPPWALLPPLSPAPTAAAALRQLSAALSAAPGASGAQSFEGELGASRALSRRKNQCLHHKNPLARF